MKALILLQLAALSTAFVVPNERVFSELRTEVHHLADEIIDRYEAAETKLHQELKDTAFEIEDSFEAIVGSSKDAVDTATAWADEAAVSAEEYLHNSYFAGKNWLETAIDRSEDCVEEEYQDALASLGIEDYSRPGHGHHGHHGPPHKPNMTVYQLIAKSKYTTKLADIISEYDDIVKLLNGTSANFTVFAPTDKAFEKIPKHAPKPSKRQLENILTYHVSSDFYPAGRIFTVRTIPTLLQSPLLSKENPQRLTTNIGFHGLTVNFYSRVIAANIFGTNGVIHGVDSLLVPPPKVLAIINFLPGEFSTLSLALTKTGLDEVLNSTKHEGGTLFAPSNHAFQKLGPKINGFLFSDYGLKYLAALLKYHVVANHTLYSDAFYNETSSKDAAVLDHDHHHHHDGPTKGVFHVDLPTLLEDRSLSVDIARFGRLIEIKINAFARVAISDGVAADGVIHVVGDVLIPPKKLGGAEEVDGTKLTLEELCDRLEPFVEPDMDEL